MITVIEKHTNHIVPDPLYQTECENCGSIIQFNQSDCIKTTSVDPHFWTYGVKCPICHKTINQDLCGMAGKGWIKIRD